MDNHSRFILAWKLCQNMSAEEIKRSVDRAVFVSWLKHVHVIHRTRLLSDNGSCCIFKELSQYLFDPGIKYVRGKTERYHCSMKNPIESEHYY